MGPKLDNFCAKTGLLLVHSSHQNSGCASGSFHCCKEIFQAIMGRRRNELSNTVCPVGLFLEMNKEFLKLHIICSLTRSEDQFLYAKFSLY